MRVEESSVRTELDAGESLAPAHGTSTHVTPPVDSWWTGPVGGVVRVGDISCYLAGDAGPGVVVLHEWWGLVPHVHDICERLAAKLSATFPYGLTQGEPNIKADSDGNLYVMAAGSTPIGCELWKLPPGAAT